MNETVRKEKDGPAAKPAVVNGVDLETLMSTVKAIKDDPELGAARFRASNRWLGANHNRTTVTGFYGAKQEIAHKQTFELDADEPAILAGSDEGANPVEHLLHALASCVTTSMVAHAAVRGIHLEEVESELEGDIDLRGFLGLADDVPRGYTDIRVKFKVKADPRDLGRLDELARYSPVFNSLTQGVNVDIQIEPK
ncbi:MAG: OsmC family protein [Gammaproteobacteria bacterium]|nr:OsmC family protein [Gammaproteobacteria bacterium]